MNFWIISAIIYSVVMLILFYVANRSDKGFRKNILDRLGEQYLEVTKLRNDVALHEGSVTSWRESYMKQSIEVESVQDHLARMREQMILLQRAHKILKNGLVKRIEVVRVDSHAKHNAKLDARLERDQTFQKLKRDMKQFDRG